MSGLQENGRWGSGTRIKDIQAYFRKYDHTLSSYPSIENGTLGGWIASGSHGSGGTLWKSSFGQVTVKDLVTNSVMDTDPADIFDKRRTISDCRRYFILDVEVKPVPNAWCKKIAYKMNSEDDADRFLTTPTYLRLLQIGRRGILALIWIPLPDEDRSMTHVDPHFGSQFGLWMQADVLSILQSSSARSQEWFDWPVEPQENFVSRIKLSDANAFTTEPPVLLSPIGLIFVNFEVFVLDYTISSHTLWTLSNALSDLYTSCLYGRCELRCGESIVFIDVVIKRTCNARPIFETIFKTLGAVDIRLHRGKAQVDTFPFLQNMENREQIETHLKNGNLVPESM